jgi:ABC-2 type transport system ATP-binding protein
VLELVDLRKRYGDIVALDGCSFSARPGRILGFLGPNGSGKTTTMRSIFGLVRLDAGRVLWQGKAVGLAERQRFGYMPEERGLYPRMTTLDQVSYFGRLHGLDAAADSAARSWLERLGLGERLGDRVEALSHGNQQRVQLALALVAQPELIVLDEPFSGLDPVASATLSEVIRSEAGRGAAVVFSSHQLDVVEDVCDDLAIIAAGKVVRSGQLHDVRQSSPHRYVQLEFAHDGAGSRDWSAILPGATVVWTQDDAVRLRVAAASTDIGAIMPALTNLGRINSLTFEPPSLNDVFIEAVKE